MKDKIKRMIQHWILCQLRQLLDYFDDRLHAAEVRLRKPIEPVSFTEWEARRSVTPVESKKATRRRRPSAAAFDLRFSQ